MLLIQSRGHPERIDRLLQVLSDERVYLRCDEDDNDLPRYDLLSVEFPKGWFFMIGPRTSAAWAFQEMLRKFPDEPWYAKVRDDDDWFQVLRVVEQSKSKE